MEEGRPEDAAVVHMLLLELQISVKNIILREKNVHYGRKVFEHQSFSVTEG